MDFSTILTSRMGLSIMVILAAVIGAGLIWKLYQILFRWFQYFFSLHAYLDEKIKKQLSRFAWNSAILLPILFIACALRMQAIQNRKEFCGIVLGWWVPVAYLAASFLFLFLAFRLLAFFSKCYHMQQTNEQRPIRPIIKFLSIMLIIVGFITVCSVLTKERPLVFLSTLGGAMALFVFAFQTLISSLVVNFQINAEKMLKVGDWIAIKDKEIEGIVVSISTLMVKIRNRDRSLISVPVRLLLDNPFVNYQPMMESGARRIKNSLMIDQRSIRFLTGNEVTELKKIHLITDEMLKKSDSFPETDDLTGEHCWTNIELFTLYVEDYLHRRPDIRHDLLTLVRAQKTTSQGLEIEHSCFSTRTLLAEFAPVQRAILYHLLAVLPSFRLRVFQNCSDIYQEIGNVPDKIGSTFHYEQLKNPIYPSDRQHLK